MAEVTENPNETASDKGLLRRQFMKSAVAGGLLIAVHVPIVRRAQAAPNQSALTSTRFEPNAFVSITPDNWVVVTVKHHEMGQGTTTGIATLVADELDADWTRVRAEYAPSNPALYNNLLWGPVQGTGGSSAMRAGYDQMRHAGATARALLVQAAAQAWHVPPAEIMVAKNTLTHKSGRRATFGELAGAAAKLPVPKDVPLKEPAQFKLIGRESTRRLDSV
ncbi:MAG: hypothetical protein RL701_10, partial [Pseudomonadota bacterium]